MMQPGLIIERLLFGVGLTLIVSSVIQYYAATTFEAQDNSIPFTLPGSKLAHLRPLRYLEQLNTGKFDGNGIESLLGKQCLDANAVWRPHIGITDCTWEASQQFNWTGGQIVVGNGKLRRCASALPESSSLDSKVILSLCNKSDPLQLWNFTDLSGRHKRFGTVVNNGTGLCLSREKARGSRQQRVLWTVPCLSANYSSSCDWGWYLPRSYQRYSNASVPAAPVPHPTRKFVRGAGRVLCWVLTQPKSHDTKAAAVNRTWGSRCDKLIFITTEDDSSIPARVLDLDGPESRTQLWNKSKIAWMHMYREYLHAAEWFVKADDDTYLSMNNLHDFLSVFDPLNRHMFGRIFRLGGRPARTYVSGGSGIILSRGALAALGEAVNATNGSVWGPKLHGPEDLQTADTLKTLGITPGRALDSKGRQLFLPLGPQYEWGRSKKDKPTWFDKYTVDTKPGPECCSERWIASHYVRYHDMYRLDNHEALMCPSHLAEWPHWRHENWGDQTDFS
eukprot:m.463945 g.463945  ORF g.463945 m.463945 type:complete len:505 (-) comp23235_c0_seq1:81-1595(-)